MGQNELVQVSVMDQTKPYCTAVMYQATLATKATHEHIYHFDRYLSWNLLVIAKPCFPDSKVHGANMGPIWGRQDPGGPHVGPMNIAIWVAFLVFWELWPSAHPVKSVNLF